MRVAAFSIQPYDRESLTAASAGLPLEWTWLEPRLDARTARLAQGATAVNCFVNDDLDAAALEALAAAGVRLVTLRCAGFICACACTSATINWLIFSLLNIISLLVRLAPPGRVNS